MHVKDVEDSKNTCIVVTCTNVEDVEDILKCMYTDYSCELNDSKSESDEVHTLELLLLMFITLSTMWCNLNVFGRGQLNPNLSFFWGGWDAVPYL